MNIESLVSERCTYTSGVFTLTGALPGFVRFSREYANGISQIPVKIEQFDRPDLFEFSLVTFAGSTLTRDAVVRSSNNDLAVEFTGPCRVFVFQPAETAKQHSADIAALQTATAGKASGSALASESAARIAADAALQA
ncbi:MAG: hypothetical protein ACRCV9_05830, partial [Burkholderiaceae bacterium]